MPKGIKESIDYNKIYKSEYDGEYKIIEDLGPNDKGYHKVNIQFIDTGNIQDAILYRAQRGQVRDRNKRIPDFNTIYQSNNFGPFKFIEILGCCDTDHKMAKIQFIETGTIVITQLSNALIGKVRDNFRPVVYGFGYIGNASSKCKGYATWHDMIRRCYDINSKEYAQYGAKGVTVCDRWRNFENFLNDIKFLPGYKDWLSNPDEFQLDKDMLQIYVPESEKVYSPETCCFIHRITNMSYMSHYQKIHNNDKASKYIGVSKSKSRQYYESSITINNKNYNLGSYASEDAAANVYNNIAKLYYGDQKVLNNVPIMLPEDIVKQRSKIVEMCKIIK